MTLKNSCYYLYALLKTGGLPLVSSVRRARHRLYYLRDATGKIVLESSHVHEFDSFDEFNQVVSNRKSRIMHTAQYQVRFSILDFILRPVDRFIRKLFTRTIATNRIMLCVRKATKISIPGYYYIETVLAKNGAYSTTIQGGFSRRLRHNMDFVATWC